MSKLSLLSMPSILSLLSIATVHAAFPIVIVFAIFNIYAVFPGQVVFIVYANGSKTDPVDVASAEPNFQSYNPQSIFILLECIIHN